MNCNKFIHGAAMICFTSILLISCQKESPNVDADVPGNNTISRMMGVAPEDAAVLAKVPMIASTDYMADEITDYFTFQENARPSGAGGKDRTSPSVNITNPSSGSTVSSTVTVQVSASDNVGVSSVQLKVNGSVVGTSYTAPYNFSWNTSGLSSGTHQLSATATDAAGNTKTHTIQVGYNTPSGADITPPSVNITSPTSGSSVSNTVAVTANASDNVGVSRVSFYVDGALHSEDVSAPYSFSLNTSTLSSGVHSISATARDAAGNTNSHAIQVSVNTTVINPPNTLPSSVILQMPAVRDQGGEGSCVAFAVGYAARSAEKFYSTGATSYNEGVNVMSPEYLFNQTKTTEYCSSSPFVWALEFLKSNGICTWQSMPYSSTNGCSVMPTAVQTAEAANFRINSYSYISTSDITAIKTQLNNKHPLMITFTVDSYFANAGPGFIWKNYSPTLYAVHAVTICGYDDSKHAVKVMNSWGTGWGEAGYSWIDYDFLPSLTPNVFGMNMQ